MGAGRGLSLGFLAIIGFNSAAFPLDGASIMILANHYAFFGVFWALTFSGPEISFPL